MWCNKDDKGTDIGKVKHSEPICQKESSMAEAWKSRMSRLSVEGVVGFVISQYLTKPGDNPETRRYGVLAPFPFFYHRNPSI